MRAQSSPDVCVNACRETYLNLSPHLFQTPNFTPKQTRLQKQCPPLLCNPKRTLLFCLSNSECCFPVHFLFFLSYVFVRVCVWICIIYSMLILCVCVIAESSSACAWPPRDCDMHFMRLTHSIVSDTSVPSLRCSGDENRGQGVYALRSAGLTVLVGWSTQRFSIYSLSGKDRQW